jgi:predicted nucleotidyltransferase
MKAKGYRSIGALAKQLGMHRNTVHHYLSGNGVFPENLEKMLSALDLKPWDVLVEKREEPTLLLEPIAPLIDQLHREFPDVTFVLFGSRTRGRAHKYSDWDIGVFSEKGMSHEEYRRIALRADELAEDLPFMVEVVNLNRADSAFLRDASRGWKFLVGTMGDWIALERKVAA